jgi:Domain of unknown function (DUF1883)
MKYAYADLGRQQRGNEVVINLRGGARNVMLLDVANFMRYRTGRSFRFTGGRYRGSPARLDVPQDGHWYAVLDLASYNSRAKATVEVIKPGSTDHQPEQEFVETASAG